MVLISVFLSSVRFPYSKRIDFRTCQVRFSIIRRTRTGFLEVGVWNRFIGFRVNAVGLSTALFLYLHQPRILQLPQGVHRLLPPTAEQSDHLADGIVQVNPSVFVRPAVLAGQLRPPQDKGVQHLCLVGQGLECRGFKEEIGEPGKADGFFRLVNVNRVCHSVFCGRLEARFPGWAVNHTVRPGLGLAEPCKSRLFPALTVHSRPPFPFTFCFLPPVNSGGAVRAVFTPVGFWDEHSPALRAAFQIPVTVNLRFQRPIQRQDRPAEPLAADGECNHLRAGAGVAIVQRKAVSAVTVAALPAYQTVGPLPLRRVHAVGGVVRLALQWRQMLIGPFSHVVPPLFFLLPFSPKRLPAPSLRRVPALVRSPALVMVSRSRVTAHFPSRGIPFQTVIRFSRACPSMNYLKCILF